MRFQAHYYSHPAWFPRCAGWRARRSGLEVGSRRCSPPSKLLVLDGDALDSAREGRIGLRRGGMRLQGLLDRRLSAGIGPAMRAATSRSLVISEGCNSRVWPVGSVFSVGLPLDFCVPGARPMMLSEVSTDFFTSRKNTPSGARRFCTGFASATISRGAGVAVVHGGVAGAGSSAVSVLSCLAQLTSKAQAMNTGSSDKDSFHTPLFGFSTPRRTMHR